MDLNSKLDRVVARHAELREQLSTRTDFDKPDYVKTSKEYAEMGAVVAAVEKFRAAQAEVRDL